MAKRRFTLGWAIYLCLASFCITDLALANGSLFASKGRLIEISFSEESVDVVSNKRISSLFQKAPKTGLFADYPPATPRTSLRSRERQSQVARLRQLIEDAESRRDGYDAVQHGARIKPGKRPTRMTLREIYAWIDDTPGQPHAIGRYQFIPDTLRRLVERLDLKPSTKFSPATQDRLADILLAEAGLNKFHKGKIEREDFMHNLSKIWAGLPSSNGKSYYHGHAGNKASISWAAFDREMGKIFPG